MNDYCIIKLLNERSEEAIKVLEEQYGALCKTIANRIVSNEQDALECVNDTLFAVWNRIPPENPNPLISYICKIVKNIALKKYEYLHAEKRNSAYEIALSELETTLSGKEMVEENLFVRELQKAINEFLGRQRQIDRMFFVRRYWFMESIPEIAVTYGKSDNYVRVHLHRTREKLKQYLNREGLIE